MFSSYALRLSAVACCAGAAGFALPPVFIRNTCAQPWLLGTETTSEPLDIRIEAPGLPAQSGTWRRGVGPVTIPPGGQVTIHLALASGSREVPLRLRRGPGPHPDMPNAMVTFSFSGERSVVKVNGLTSEPLEAEGATLTIRQDGLVHLTSLPAPPPTAAVVVPRGGIQREVVLVNPLTTGGTWKLRWSAREGEGPGVAFTDGGAALPVKTVNRAWGVHGIDLPCGRQVSLRPTGGPEGLKRIGLASALNREGLKNPFQASLDLRILWAESALGVRYLAGEPPTPPFIVTGNVLTFTRGDWEEPGTPAARKAPRKRPAAAAPAPPAPRVAGDEEVAGDLLGFEGVVIVNRSARNWFLKWSGKGELSSGLTFEGDMTVGKFTEAGRNQVIIPSCAVVRVKPAGRLEDIRKLGLYSLSVEGRHHRNPHQARVTMAFNGARSKVAVTYGKKGAPPGVPPYATKGQVLILTGNGWDESPSGSKRKAPSEPARSAPSRASAGAPAGAPGPVVNASGKKPRLDAMPQPASLALAPPPLAFDPDRVCRTAVIINASDAPWDVARPEGGHGVALLPLGGVFAFDHVVWFQPLFEAPARVTLPPRTELHVLLPSGGAVHELQLRLWDRHGRNPFNAQLYFRREDRPGGRWVADLAHDAEDDPELAHRFGPAFRKVLTYGVGTIRLLEAAWPGELLLERKAPHDSSPVPGVEGKAQDAS